MCSEFFNDRIKCEEVDVFEMIVGSAGFFEFFGRLSWKDSFEDA